jgi:hypothetical protein
MYTKLSRTLFNRSWGVETLKRAVALLALSGAIASSNPASATAQANCTAALPAFQAALQTKTIEALQSYLDEHAPCFEKPVIELLAKLRAETAEAPAPSPQPDPAEQSAAAEQPVSPTIDTQVSPTIAVEQPADADQTVLQPISPQVSTPLPGDGTTQDPASSDTDTASLATSVPATEEDETLLGLNRDQRREIQRRLTLIGFDTNGVDGALGRKSRAAISNWQQDRGLPVSGFLNEAQVSLLSSESQELYEKWLEEDRNRPQRRQVRVCDRGLFGARVNCRREWR